MLKTPLLFAASLFAAATVLGGTAAPALAAPPEPQTRAVGYADLNLASPAGRARLAQRIDAAARAVCGWAAPTDLNGLDQVQQCRAEAVADAEAQRRTGRVFIAEADGGEIVFRPR